MSNGLYRRLANIEVPSSAGAATRRALEAAREELETGLVGRISEKPAMLLAERVASAIENVPFYRDLYRSLGSIPLKSASIGSWFDELPIIEKSELSSIPLADRLNARWDMDNLVQKRTSGSTGIPFELLIDEVLASFRSWRIRRPHTLAGCPASEGIAFLFPPSFRQIPRVMADEKETETESGSEPSPSALIDGFIPAQDIFDELCARKPRTLIGFASVITNVARWMLANGRSLDTVRSIWTTSEALSPSDAETIEQGFGAEPLEAYASNEFGFIAHQEKTGGPLLVDWDRLLVEIEPHESYSGLGVVVITDLLNDAMPLIRYRTGDLAILPAGSAMLRTDRLEGFVGKEADLIVLGSGRVVTTFEILACVKDHLPGAQYRVVCIDPRTFVVQCCPGSSYDARNEDSVRVALSGVLGADVTILVQRIGRIDREGSGKLRPLVNLTNLGSSKRVEMIGDLGLSEAFGSSVKGTDPVGRQKES